MIITLCTEFIMLPRFLEKQQPCNLLLREKD
jgi:hypothetical protein